MEQMIPVTIDGVQVEVPAGSTVLEAAHKANVKIPTLCFLKDINETANCRICVVDCGGRTLQAACVLPVTPGMVVKTNTPAVREARRMNLELILSNHDKKCLTCVRSENCELQTLAEELGVTGEEPEFLFAQRNEYHGAFHGKPFHDNEIAWVYLLVLDRPEEAFTPEACEVESVHWFSVREILRAMRENDPRFCLREAEFCRLLPYLAQKFGIPVDKL